jgi:hypothetical protein
MRTGKPWCSAQTTPCTPLTRLFGSVAPLPRCPQRHWELTLALVGLLLGVVDHPLA